MCRNKEEELSSLLIKSYSLKDQLLCILFGKILNFAITTGNDVVLKSCELTGLTDQGGSEEGNK